MTLVQICTKAASPRVGTGVDTVRHVGTRCMIAALPPAADASLAAKLRLELRLTPTVDREDAVQEAWLAYLEGRSPARAVNTFSQRERRHRKRQTAVEGFDHYMRPLESGRAR